MNSFEVGDARIDDAPNGMIELNGSIGGERCWFRVPAERGLELRGEPFLIAGLLPAMQAGLPLRLDHRLAVCPRLLQNLDRIQHIFRLWGAAFKTRFTVVPIEANTAPAPPGRENAVFFSGGVDGTHALLEAPEPPEAAAFVRGVDFQLDNPVYDQSFARNRAWLANRGVALLPMDSNLRWVARSHGLGWGTYFGAGLATFGHVFGFRRTWIASGHSWRNLIIEGSHPCTDHYWSSSSREIIHFGRDWRRWEKLERIAVEPGALEILRVCWQDDGFNCGKCEKCIRTMVTLRLLGVESPSFPPLTDLRLVSNFVPGHEGEAVFIEESIELARKRNDRPLETALGKSLRRWRLRELARDADQLLLGGLGKRLRNMLG